MIINERPRRAFTQEEIILLRDSFSGKYAIRNQAFFLLRVYSGLRAGEALSLRVKDIYREGKILEETYLIKSNTKSRQGMYFDIPPYIKPYLYGLVENRDSQRPLFESQKGGQLQTRSVWKIENALAKSLGLDVSFLGTHSARKYYAQVFYELTGFDIVRTADALGHSNINSTRAYLRKKDQPKVFIPEI